MAKKAQSSPMKALLGKIQSLNPQVTVSVFAEETLLNDPIASWPKVDALIAFFSTGYPLEKVREYVESTGVFVFNDIQPQTDLLSRTAIHEALEAAGVPMAQTLVVPHPSPDFYEDSSSITFNGKTLKKPFVEKSEDAENHDVHIYYPNGQGGRALFRKVGNVSSQARPDLDSVRRDTTYIYEQLLPADNGVDIKVYMVGYDFVHGEARKAPTVDGVVERGPDGKELREVVELSDHEKSIARRVYAAFGQAVCGFDLIRVNGHPYVIDVNGWSFVKNSPEYTEAAAKLINSWCQTRTRPHRPAVDTLSPPITPMGSPVTRLHPSSTITHGSNE